MSELQTPESLIIKNKLSKRTKRKACALTKAQAFTANSLYLLDFDNLSEEKPAKILI